MTAYYNEIDRYCCDWLSNLIDAGHITPGKIDDRSIEEVSARDVAEYERIHFFAGIGGWELALRISGWQGRVWTGSCPCQPLSSAGQRKGHVDGSTCAGGLSPAVEPLAQHQCVTPPLISRWSMRIHCVAAHSAALNGSRG